MTDTTGRYAPDHIKRLKDAIEGECDGLTINDKHAEAILQYVFEDATHALMAAQRPQDVPMWLKELERLAVRYGNSCTAMGEDWSRVRQEKVQADRAALMAHASQRPAESWRDAVEHELTVLHLSCPDDPKKAIQDLISWHCTISLDPAVSSDARALVERGRQEALASRPVPPPISEDAKDCRTCANHATCAEKWHYGDSHLVKCKNGDLYKPTQIARLWKGGV